jgi:hypothetical protein
VECRKNSEFFSTEGRVTKNSSHGMEEKFCIELFLSQGNVTKNPSHGTGEFNKVLFRSGRGVTKNPFTRYGKKIS